MLVQAGLCRICSETTLLVFPRGGSNGNINIFYVINSMSAIIAKRLKIIKIIIILIDTILFCSAVFNSLLKKMVSICSGVFIIGPVFNTPKTEYGSFSLNQIKPQGTSFIFYFGFKVLLLRFSSRRNVSIGIPLGEVERGTEVERSDS